MQNLSEIISQAEKAATDILLSLPEQLVFHNYNHTLEVVKAAQKIGRLVNLTGDETEIVLIAAWFHDTGFMEGYENHEEKSMEYAEKFLKEISYPPQETERVLACIRSTKPGIEPITLTEQVLHDADFIHLSKKSYFEKVRLLKQEMEWHSGRNIPDNEWYSANLRFLKSHKFYTSYGKTVLTLRLNDNIKRQEKMLMKMEDEIMSSELGLDTQKIKELKKKLKQAEGRPDRGIETMFRLTSRNHLRLSSIADSKANILISINSIIISIIISGLIKTLDNHPYHVIPTYMTLTINVVTIIFAIIVLRPNVTKGKFTRKEIEERKTNLLFFGNFHGMTRDDYRWGMLEMMNDSKYLYSSLIDDIYFLGKVLGKKYKYLRWSYNIFMYGIIVVVIAFGLANYLYLRGINI